MKRFICGGLAVGLALGAALGVSCGIGAGVAQASEAETQAAALAAPVHVRAQWAGRDAQGHLSGVIVTWDEVPRALSYNIYRGTQVFPRPVGSSELLRKGVVATSFVHSSASMGVDSIPFYQVSSVNAQGESPKSAPVEPAVPTPAASVVVQGTITRINGRTLLVKTPDRRPVCPPGRPCPHFVILGATFEVHTANAVFENADGTPVTPAPTLTVGEAIVVSGQGNGQGTPMHPAVIEAQVIEAAAPSDSGHQEDSGIEGVALVGPVRPVEQPGQPNERPLANALISIRASGGTGEVALVRTDAQGKFRVLLPAGRYLLVGLPLQPGQTLPRGDSQGVTVEPEQFTQATVHYDSGIR